MKPAPPTATSAPHPRERRRLPLIAPGDELKGDVSRGYERASGTASAGSAKHHAVLFAGSTLVRHAFSECLPPSESTRLMHAPTRVVDWAHGKSDFRSVRDARTRLFEEAQVSEQAVLKAITPLFEVKVETPLHQHALDVARRYVGLATQRSISAALLLIDAVTEPKAAADVPMEVAAAIAYRNVGFGAARNRELRQSAEDQASWEHARVVSSAPHATSSLQLQLYHEYLGVHWKNQVDAQRLYLEEFLSWVFPT